jgi:hypothetical protein
MFLYVRLSYTFACAYTHTTEYTHRRMHTRTSTDTNVPTSINYIHTRILITYKHTRSGHGGVGDPAPARGTAEGTKGQATRIACSICIHTTQPHARIQIHSCTHIHTRTHIHIHTAFCTSQEQDDAQLRLLQESISRLQQELHARHGPAAVLRTRASSLPNNVGSMSQRQGPGPGGGRSGEGIGMMGELGDMSNVVEESAGNLSLPSGSNTRERRKQVV